MERTEVDRSSNLEPGGRCLSRPGWKALTGIESLRLTGLQATMCEGKEVWADPK